MLPGSKAYQPEAMHLAVCGADHASCCHQRAAVPQPKDWTHTVTDCQWHSSKGTPLVGHIKVAGTSLC